MYATLAKGGSNHHSMQPLSEGQVRAVQMRADQATGACDELLRHAEAAPTSAAL
jgi:hypothetical protein